MGHHQRCTETCGVGTGVAHSKLLAKLCSGLNKPNKQTVVPQCSVASLLHGLPLERLRGLGGGQGQRVRACLRVDTVGAAAHATAMTSIVSPVPVCSLQQVHSIVV